MGVEKEGEASMVGQTIYVVQATDAEGRVMARDSFLAKPDSDARAAELRAQGFTVAQTTVEPPAG